MPGGGGGPCGPRDQAEMCGKGSLEERASHHKTRGKKETAFWAELQKEV